MYDQSDVERRIRDHNPNSVESLRSMSGTTSRSLLILGYIPKYPRRLSTPEIWQKVKDDGHAITLRSIQRSLIDLSAQFGLGSEQEGRTQYWFWPADFKRLDIPGLTPEQALIFHLAKSYLQPALPQSYLDELGSFFERADAVLAAGSSKASLWRKRIRVIQRGPSLAVPEIKSGIVRTLHEALLSGKRVAIKYKKRGETKTSESEISIHGMVVREGLVYAIVTFWDYKKPLQIVFHRVKQATLLDTAATSIKDFDIDEYLQQDQAFAYPVDQSLINLRMSVNPYIAEHLAERPLSANQTQKQVSTELFEINAQVPNTHELRWWLRGFGGGLEVLAPKSLRDEMKDTVVRMSKRYNK